MEPTATVDRPVIVKQKRPRRRNLLLVAAIAVLSASALAACNPSDGFDERRPVYQALQAVRRSPNMNNIGCHTFDAPPGATTHHTACSATGVNGPIRLATTFSGSGNDAFTYVTISPGQGGDWFSMKSWSVRCAWHKNGNSWNQGGCGKPVMR